MPRGETELRGVYPEGTVGSRRGAKRCSAGGTQMQQNRGPAVQPGRDWWKLMSFGLRLLLHRSGRGPDRRAQKQQQRRHFLNREAFPRVFSACAAGVGVPLAAPGMGIFIFFRSKFSIFPRMSACSFKNTRAFSRPWPSRSPPNEIHVPDFSRTPFSTPRSIKSPSRWKRLRRRGCQTQPRGTGQLPCS